MAQTELIRILKEAGIKPTSQRVLILDYLMNHPDHPSSEQIYQSLHSEVSVLSRATVYNTVNIFKEKGLIRVLDTGDEVAHYDIDLSDHAHFQCRKCRRIWNIGLPAKAESSLVLPEGFKAEDLQVLVKGICRECREKDRREKEQAEKGQPEKDQPEKEQP